MYSILNSFGQRSQCIRIKFTLYKQSENPWMCYLPRQSTAWDFMVLAKSSGLFTRNQSEQHLAVCCMDCNIKTYYDLIWILKVPSESVAPGTFFFTCEGCFISNLKKDHSQGTKLINCKFEIWVTGNKPHPTSWSPQQFLIYNCCCRAE
jgi:hypothetical protein